MTGRRTRLALIGTGFIADAHLQGLRGLRDVELVAVCDAAPGRAERMARQKGIERAFSSLDEMLAAMPAGKQGGLDAVHLLVPPGLHRDLAKRCLEAGLSVLVEKPMVLRAAEVDELEALARQRSVVLAVNHNQTFHPAVR